MKKTQHFIRPLSKQVDRVLSMFALSGLREGLKNNGVDNITDFVEAKTVEQEKRDNVLRCDLGRLGVVKKANGAVALTGSQLYADAEIQDHEFFKKKLREISAAFGGNESLAVSIYRLCCGQGGNDIFYKGKDEGEYRTGYWVSSNLMTFFKYSMSEMGFQLNKDNASVVIRKKAGEDDILLFEFSQHFLPDVAANLSGNATFKIVIEAKIIEGEGLDITSVKEISFDTVLESESADELNAAMREMKQSFVDGISAFDKSNVEHPNALKSGLAFITLQENMLTIQKGDVVSEYDISGPNQAAVSDALSKLVDVLPQLEDTVIRQLIDVLSHCEPKVSEQLTSVLSRCNSRTAGVLVDILSQSNIVSSGFITALNAKKGELTKGFSSLRSVADNVEVPLLPMFKDLKLLGLNKHDAIEVILFLSRYGKRAQDALLRIATADANTTRAETINGGDVSRFVTILFSDNCEKARDELARALSEDNRGNLELLKLAALQVKQQKKEVSQAVEPLSAEESQVFAAGLAGLQQSEPSWTKSLVFKLQSCGFTRKNIKKFLNSQYPVIPEFQSVLLQSDNASAKLAVKIVLKCGADFVKLISSIDRKVGYWLYGYAKLLDTRSKKSAIKITAGWAKFSESKSCGESVLSQSVFKVENREYPLFGLVASHSHPEAFAQALVSLKEAGAEFNDALVQCVFKMNEQQLKTIAGKNTARALKTNYDTLFPKGSQTLVQFDMFLKNMLGIPEDKKSLMNNILRRAGELFASINIVISGKKIDLGWLMGRLVRMANAELAILLDTVQKFDAGELLKQQSSQVKCDMVSGFLQYVSDPRDKQAAIQTVVEFLKEHKEGLTAASFNDLQGLYSDRVVAEIKRVPTPAKRRGLFQRMRDWFIQNIVHRKTSHQFVSEVLQAEHEKRVEPVVDRGKEESYTDIIAGTGSREKLSDASTPPGSPSSKDRRVLVGMPVAVTGSAAQPPPAARSLRMDTR